MIVVDGIPLLAAVMLMMLPPPPLAVAAVLHTHTRTRARDEQPPTQISNQLKLKYGKEFHQRALSNEGGCVNERVLHKLSIRPPTAYLVRE